MRNKKRISVASILVCGCRHEFVKETIEFLPDWNVDVLEHINKNHEKLTFLPYRGYRVKQCKFCGFLKREITGMTTNIPINLDGSIIKKKIKWNLGLDLAKGVDRNEKTIVNITDTNNK